MLLIFAFAANITSRSRAFAPFDTFSRMARQAVRLGKQARGLPVDSLYWWQRIIPSAFLES